MPLRKSAVVALANGITPLNQFIPQYSCAPGNEDAGRLPKHDKYDFLPYFPTVITQDRIPELVLAGERDQQPISRKHSCELVGQGAIQCCIHFVRANTLAEG